MKQVRDWAGTRGSSLGIDALKVASLNCNSDFFTRHQSIVLKVSIAKLFDQLKYPKAKRIESVIESFEIIAGQVSDQLLKNNFPILLSGDHSCAGGPVQLE